MTEIETRGKVYNNIVEDKFHLVNENNRYLLEDWVKYLKGIDRAETTIKKYINDFQFWCVWNYENNRDKDFFKISKKDIINFQAFCIDLEHSPARIRSLRSCISSLSNYIENILDDEYPTFKNIVNKIEAPKLTSVREKLVLSTEDVESLLEKLTDDGKYQQACYLALAGYSGARKSELLRFKTEYFKDEYVECGLYKTPEKIKTKGRSSRGKLLYKWTIKKNFDQYLNNWMDKRNELGIDSEWLFVTKKNGDWVQAKITTADSWAETISKYLGQPFYAHSLRHYYCTSLVRSNIPSHIIKEIIGWASESMIQVYNDIEASDEFSKYFSDNGIIEQEENELKNL